MKIEEIEVGGVYEGGRLGVQHECKVNDCRVKRIQGQRLHTVRVASDGKTSTNAMTIRSIIAFADWATKRIDTREDSHAQAE